ncbi:MAG: cyclic nucleotide-binding domain-containing protein [Betaproteobacteria bacterium]|nr:MAG: cyclic nucleotide-binding domain-containing protein [Betaproteobacteria bacterium]TMH77392.1 MAG: cyclic nucleotide-binding domain-containing protein [Betaproteobacteria bacterium]
MSELDFTKPEKPAKPPVEAPAKPSIYDPAMAMEFFGSAGKPETIAQGTTIFTENEKGNRLLLQRDRMYLLLDGEVSLIAKNKAIGRIGKGEIFGEMASISEMPRSATAVAKIPCRVIGLDDSQFQSALRKRPEFALMLMSVMIRRMRDAISRQNPGGPASAGKMKESAVFDKSALAILSRALSQTTVRYERNKVIVKEGQAGLMMYVVLEGRLAVSIQDKIVEKIGPGGVFGEMALVERTPRLATVTSETDCGLLAFGRNTLLDLIKASPDFAVSLLGAVGDRARFIASR